MENIILTQETGGILEIQLNRPQQLNALSHEVLKKFSEILSEVKLNKTIKGILITGQGKAFCAGADIKGLLRLTSIEGTNFARFGQDVFRQLETLGKPSIAAIHGFAFGGGLELSMAATMRLAVENTIFGQPEIKLGVIPGFGGTQRLARLVGKGRALDLCLTGRKFNASDALNWGLVSEITSQEALLTKARSILNELIQYSPTALSSIMATIDEGYNLSLAEALALEAAYFGVCCGTNDKKEGVSAFLEKRQPVFNGT